MRYLMFDEFQALVPDGISLLAVFCQSLSHNLDSGESSKRTNEGRGKFEVNYELLLHISMNHEAAVSGGYEANPIRQGHQICCESSKHHTTASIRRHSNWRKDESMRVV